MAWFGMGVHYGEFRDSHSVWPIFRDNQIACNGHARGANPNIDAIMDQIKYGDYIVLKSFSPNTGICVYGIAKCIAMNTYPYPIPNGYENQCIGVNWILRSVDDDYVDHFPTLLGGHYSAQLFPFPPSGVSVITDWLNRIGIRV